MGSDRSFLNPLSLSGLAATLVGNGIGRFAYIALMPVLIQQAWFTRTDAALLGAATLLGYLVGAPFTNRLSRLMPCHAMMRAALLTCSVSYFACAWQGGWLGWFYVWRFLAGVGGAVAMVLAPYLVLSRSPLAQRGRTSGVVFSGVGFGIMASGTVIPLIVRFGIVETWLVLGGICLLLTTATWTQWCEATKHAGARPGQHQPVAGPIPADRLLPLSLLLAAYALNAVGYLPHTLFWVDYIVRELHWSIAAGGFFWAIFGIAAAAGPFVTGAMADCIGFSWTLFIGFLLKALGVALPLLDNSWGSLFFSSLLAGTFTPGIAAVVSGYAMTIVGVDRHKRAWGWITSSFAASQCVTGFAMVFMMNQHESYYLLFFVSACALVVSSLCIAAMKLRSGNVFVHRLEVRTN